MITATINKIETMGLVDGPGIRTVIFFQECNLRCKFCHNPETWNKGNNKTTIQKLKSKILRYKPYYQKNGGVTFSGGEPLLQQAFLTKLCKELKKENIHIALDTAGIGKGNYEELLSLVDLIILDIKYTTKQGFQNITQTDQYDEFINFIKQVNKSNKEVWIRQVIIPGENDNKNYINDLVNFLKNNIKNITKIELLPFHTLGFQKYKEYHIKNPYNNKKAMDKEKCKKLEDYCLKKYKEF